MIKALVTMPASGVLPSNRDCSDMIQGIAFLQALADHSLPMLQNESQFHAARVFSSFVAASTLRQECATMHHRL